MPAAISLGFTYICIRIVTKVFTKITFAFISSNMGNIETKLNQDCKS
jgi:hypothetical protein